MEVDELGAAARLERLPDDVRWPVERALAHWRDGALDAAAEALAVAAATVAFADDRFARFHVLHLRACVAFSARDYATARSLHGEVLAHCHEIGFLGGMASSLCDLAVIDLVEGDTDGARVRYERGVACYDEGGYTEQAAQARAMWARAAAS